VSCMVCARCQTQVTRAEGDRRRLASRLARRVSLSASERGQLDRAQHWVSWHRAALAAHVGVCAVAVAS
jgi:hypothetical protein